VKRELADGIAIRYAEEGEADALFGLAAAAGHPADLVLVEALAIAGRVFVAVRHDGERVGVAAVGDLDGMMTVETLAVLPAARRQGVGSALVTTVEEYARWAYYASVLAVPQDADASNFLFRRGYLALDAGRLPEAVTRLGHGKAVVVKKL
jgi:N-acetylglutamate synthase-like GNAT family acetyltransferase